MKSIENIQRKIHEIRGIKVILDIDLACMYEIETRILNQAVKRKQKRCATPVSDRAETD